MEEGGQRSKRPNFVTQDRRALGLFHPIALLITLGQIPHPFMPTMHFFWRSESCIGSHNPVAKEIEPTKNGPHNSESPIEALFSDSMVGKPLTIDIIFPWVVSFTYP